MPDTPFTSETIRAAQEWWALAGVDMAFTDEPGSWLPEADEGTAPAASPVRAEVQAAPSAPSLGGDPASWPQTLADFDAWWLAEPTLGLGSTAPRPGHRGPADAKLMVIVPQPEIEDGETLLSGPQGALLANVIGAMGLSADEVRLGTALPRPSPAADWTALDHAGLGALTRHHVALAAPKRLLVLGRNVLPLLGCDPALDPRQPAACDCNGKKIPLLAARDPAVLLTSPAARRSLWQRWLQWNPDA